MNCIMPNLRDCDNHEVNGTCYVVAHKMVESKRLKDIPVLVREAYEAFSDRFFNQIAYTAEELEEFIPDVFGYGTMEEMLNDNMAKKLYCKMLKKINEGYAISEVCLFDNEKEAQEIFISLVTRKKILLIYTV